MPAYNLASHGELAPFLEKHPGLFGFYTDKMAIDTEDSWMRDTGIMAQPLSHHAHARSFLARLYEMPSNAQVSPTQVPYRRPRRHDVTVVGAECNSRTEYEPDWVNKKYTIGSAQPEVRRSNAISRRQGRYFRTPESSTVPSTPGKSQAPKIKYDLDHLDNLLSRLMSLITASSLHLKPGIRATSTAPVPLPRRITDQLNDMYLYLYIPQASLIPLHSNDKVSSQFLSKAYPISWSIHTVPSPPHFDQHLPAPLASHPPPKKIDPKAGRFRAMRILGYSVGSRRYLLPSIIALLTAKAVVEHCQMAIKALARNKKVPSNRTHLDAISYSVREHGLEATTSGDNRFGMHKLGHGYYQRLPVTPESERHSGMLSSPHSTTSVLEFYNKPDPVSAWSPWSTSSSSSSIYDSGGSSRTSRSKAFASSCTPQSSGTPLLDELHIRQIELRDLQRHIEKQLRLLGSRIWTNSTRRNVYTSVDDEAWFVDRELEKCRKTLVKEGYLR